MGSIRITVKEELIHIIVQKSYWTTMVKSTLCLCIVIVALTSSQEQAGIGSDTNGNKCTGEGCLLSMPTQLVKNSAQFTYYLASIIAGFGTIVETLFSVFQTTGPMPEYEIAKSILNLVSGIYQFSTGSFAFIDIVS